MMKRAGLIFFGLCYALASLAQKPYHEQYRPQIHFSPPAHWMNDPNGLVYYKGVYHLFYQYYPNATVWGPMHWGHATSIDLNHWKNKPIALYPDSIGLIFSGSVVVDYNNTSGFGKNGQPPLVAIFTQHNQAREKAGRNDAQNQSIAYSNDGGNTWTKYAHNPVLLNPGITDFRDPKVMWYAPQKKWIMTLATKDRITFYSSKNLKQWTKESEFGQDMGAHGGVWECPDLFPMTANDGRKMWVLIVNINPGGPQGGSATQYFTGNFNGKIFTANSKETRWVDCGADEYAGVTYSNTGNRRIFLGWMSNWQYASLVPTKEWRSAMTIPRDLKLKKVGEDYDVASEPVKELNSIKGPSLSIKRSKIVGDQYELDISAEKLSSFFVTLSNDNNEKLIVGFDLSKNAWYIDRTNAGESGFSKDFVKYISAPRIIPSPNSDVTLIVDAASVELFADHGLTTMTSIFFPKKPLNKVSLDSSDGFVAKNFSCTPLKSIWK
ncbi:MAG TPA: glycoside hydrolase family 32 protein [Mucilaginibacter sp.]|jgi:fructan beta-fructosidase|nr:glycoside hydrolase family 32 protein [Mucilaginibacter sp.]